MTDRHYHEAHSRIPGAVRWYSRTDRDATTRVLPDGCMDLIWTGGEIVIAGPDTRAHLHTGRRGEGLAAVRFAPGTAPGYLGIPAVRLRDERVALGDAVGVRPARECAARVADAADPAAALEDVAHRLRAHASPRAAPVPAGLPAALCRQVRAGARIAQAADALGYSRRHLHRLCLASFGYPAATLARILRLTRALELARAGGTFARAAAAAGYADQAHLAREVRALTGVRLGALVG